MKKNIIYDLLNNNCLEAINPESSFQYYDLSKLSADIGLAEKHKLSLVNLFTEPVKTSLIIDRYFTGKKVGSKAGRAGFYNLKTKHARLWGKTDYCYSAAEVLQQLGEFIKGSQ